MTTLKQKLKSIGAVVGLMVFGPYAYSAVLIDGFTDFQYAQGSVQYSDPAGSNVISALNVTDTLLGNLHRSLQAGDGSTEVVVDGGALSIATSSADQVSVFYSFDAIDLSALAKAFSLNMSVDDLAGVQIQIIANGISVFGFSSLGGIGQYVVDFSQFTDTSVFKHLNTLELKLAGPQAWDAEFGMLATVSKVPEPPVMALTLLGLVVMGAKVRKPSE